MLKQKLKGMKGNKGGGEERQHKKKEEKKGGKEKKGKKEEYTKLSQLDRKLKHLNY